jgi:hypothetical protein
MKPRGLDLIRGVERGRHLPLSSPRERNFPLLALPMNGDPGSSQILTQHCGA